MQHDPMIADLQHERRARLALVIAAVIGILASVACGLAFALGDFAPGATGHRNPGAIVFFVGPFAVSMAIGDAVYRVLRRRRARG